jgi:DNA polymerase III epsilon subunit-like protein
MLATIDFEMTALAFHADMIEAGIALWSSGEPIRTWSSLIRPRPNCLWSSESAAVHGIQRHELAPAPEPIVVAKKLNALLTDVGIAFCDGLPHDLIWMRGMFQLAAVKPGFRLAPIEAMPGLDQPDRARKMWEVLESVKAPHRAGADAVLLMRAYASSVGECPVLQDIE